MGRRGGVERNLHQQVIDAGMDDRIFIFEDVPHQDVLATMAGATLFVLPSRIEPFGIVLLEAAMTGVPVVATNTGGIPEIVETSSMNGLLVAPENEEALSDAILESITNRAEAMVRADRLRNRVALNFDLSKVAEKYENMVLNQYPRSRE
jgi:glycosyltransferase involved in cell wall biosynthesis